MSQRGAQRALAERLHGHLLLTAMVPRQLSPLCLLCLAGHVACGGTVHLLAAGEARHETGLRMKQQGIAVAL